MYKADSSDVAFGEKAMKVVLEILKRIGFSVIRLDTTNGDKSALFVADGKATPAMDIMAIGHGKTILFDSKGKHHSTYTYTQDREDHGIDKKNFDEYLKQCKEGGIEPWIALYEEARETARGVFEKSRVVLLYRLDKLLGFREVDASVATYGKGGMVYWLRGCFQNKYNVEDFIDEPPFYTEAEKQASEIAKDASWLT